MKNIKRRIIIGSALFIALWTAQTAFAWYDPSTGRWLTRDPIGEPGFQALQRVAALPQTGSPPSQANRWINRDPVGEADSETELTGRPGEVNLYTFVLNDPQNRVDPLGLLTFEGCRPDQQQQIQNDWNSFCQQVKSSAFQCCLKHFNIPQRLAAMCDRADTKIKCHASNTGMCKDTCGWSLPFGGTIHMCPLGLTPDPQCGPYGCTLLHEMTHLAGHWPEKWADRVENCLQGCPQRPIH